MRSDRERLEDILEACRTIRKRIAPRLDELEQDEILQLATERAIEIIGEAASRLSEEFEPSIPKSTGADRPAFA